jgi:hypothetical protein
MVFQGALRKMGPPKRKTNLSEEKKPDLRIVRIATSIYKSDFLSDYYLNEKNVNLACKYLGFGEVRSVKSIEDLINFLNYLYNSKVENFRNFMEYTLNEIMEEDTFDIIAVSNDFHRFRRELETLGLIYDVDNGKIVPATGHEDTKQIERTGLEKMLARLDPRFAKLHQQAWNALLLDESDGPRQSVNSIKELLNQILHHLVPEEGLTRMQRLTKILDFEETDFVESLAELIDSLQSLQSKRTHIMSDLESALFIVLETENVLYYILKKSALGYKHHQHKFRDLHRQT